MLTSAEVCLCIFDNFFILTCTCCLLLVYQKLGYIELVGRAAELSMQSCVEEVQALPEYSTKGEVKMTTNYTL